MNFTVMFSLLSKAVLFIPFLTKASWVLKPEVLMKLIGLIISGVGVAQALFTTNKENITDIEREAENTLKKNKATEFIKAGFVLFSLEFSFDESTKKFVNDEVIPQTIDFIVLCLKTTGFLQKPSLVK